MVFFGTGRLFNSNDKATSAPQRIYGVIDTSLLAAGLEAGLWADRFTLRHLTIGAEALTGVPTGCTPA